MRESLHRFRRAAVLILVVGLRVPTGSAMADPPMPDIKVTASPSAVQSGARFVITGLSATTNINLLPPSDAPKSSGKPEADSWINVLGQLTVPKGAAAVCPWRMEITSALDERERELVRPGEDDHSDEPRSRRYQMAYGLMQWITQDEQSRNHEMPMQDTLRGIRGLPVRLMRVTGFAEAVVASKVVARPIELKAMAEPLELVPGLTLLITEVEANERRATIEFEVRTRRFRDADAGTPGLEPVFIGLVLRDEAGNLMQVLRDGQEVDTRDEFLLVGKHQGLSKDYLKRVKTVEAVAAGGLETMRLNFELSNVDLGRGE